MRCIGLTGGIASGKTSVARLLEAAGAIVLDADTIAHELMSPAGAAYQPVLDHFGTEILQANGEIDRLKLGTRVFSQPAELAQLNALVHPLVRQVLLQQVAAYRSRAQAAGQNWLLVLVIPLLYESDLAQLVDQVWVVYCPEAEQIRRLMQRNGLSTAEALLRIRAQWPIEEKKQRADQVIDNSGQLDATRNQVMKWLGECPWDPYLASVEQR